MTFKQVFRHHHVLPVTFVIFILILIFAAGNDQAKTLTLHVALSGNDQWSGTIPYPNKLKSDGPLRTFQQAWQRIQKQKSQYTLIQVIIHEGTYVINNELVFSGNKSGSQDAEIIIRAFREDKVCFSGSNILGTIKKIQDPQTLKGIHPAARGKLYTAELNIQDRQQSISLDNTGAAMMVIHNGSPMRLCQYPANDWLLVAAIKGSVSTGITIGYVAEANTEQRPDRNTYLYGYWKFDWAGAYQKISTYHADKNEIELSPPYHSYGYDENQRFRFCNVLSSLDEPNEYYIDFEQKKIIFWPENAPGKLEAVLRSNVKNSINFIHSRQVTITNICFENFYGPVINVINSHNIVFRNCTIRNVVTSAVKIEGGKGNGIDSCEIHNIGASGIILSGGNRSNLEKGGNFVKNTRIRDFAQIDKTYQPAIHVSGVGQLVSHNHIYNGPHQGIRIIGNDHCIEYNELDHLALETGDVGAIYMGRDWTFRGNLFQFNYFHDLKGPGKYGATGIYLDDAASGSTVFGNIFIRCDKGIQIGGGRDNLVCNNIFLFCFPAIKIDNRGENDAKSAISINGSWKMYDKLKAVAYDTPPYSLAYPKLGTLLQDNPAVPAGNGIVDNVYCNSEFLIRKPDSDSYWRELLMLDKNIQCLNTPSDIRNYDPSLIRFIMKQAQQSNNDFKEIPWEEIGLPDR